MEKEKRERKGSYIGIALLDARKYKPNLLDSYLSDGYLPQWGPSWNQSDEITGRCVCFLSNNQMRVSYCDGATNGELDRIVGPEWVRLPDVLTRSSNVETRRRGGQCDGATLRWKVKLKDH
ncbi:hypothetical protein T12_15715 [Trichinella patagoniensis]|uniref:Uncharacterized protein n=1 Tax=Trichinella patagoniensis TaxID=990121 RepID=A0A0V1A8B7_9BILA|nr:hypothetical protein T12_15715 [Trichinella patagoniensis]